MDILLILNSITMTEKYIMKQTIKRWVVNLQATLAVALMLPAVHVFAQDCPTPTLTAPAICAGQTPNFVLSTSPASAGPYSLVINGTSYTGVVPGTQIGRASCRERV